MCSMFCGSKIVPCSLFSVNYDSIGQLFGDLLSVIVKLFSSVNNGEIAIIIKILLKILKIRVYI